MPVCARVDSVERTERCGAARSTTGMRRAASGVELGSPTGMLPQYLGWREADTVSLGEMLEIAQNAFGTEVIRVPQRAAAEGREAESEDRADVAVSRIADHALAQGPRRLIDHAEHEPLQDLRGTRAAVGMNAKQTVYTVIHAAFLAALIVIEAWARFASEAAGLHQRGDAFARDRHDVLAVRLLHHARHLDGDIEADLVEQRDWPNRESETHRHAVDVFDRRALRQEVANFVRVGSKDSVHPESRAVLHDDHGLAHPPAECDRGTHGLRLRARARYDFDQRHLRDGRKEMHPDDALRRARRFGDAGDRDRRGVRRKDAVRWQNGFDVPQDLLFHSQLFEHRLDRQLRAAEACVAVTTRAQRDEPRVFDLGDAAQLQPVIQNRTLRETSLLYAHHS